MELQAARVCVRVGSGLEGRGEAGEGGSGEWSNRSAQLKTSPRANREEQLLAQDFLAPEVGQLQQAAIRRAEGQGVSAMAGMPPRALVQLGRAT